MSLVLQGPLALLLALLLNRQMRGQSVIRVLIFVPYVIAEVVVGTGWSLMLQSTAPLNGLLENIGLGALHSDWLADPSIAIWTLMAIITWKYIGFAVILFLAGLQGIPEELSEAAAIDGASYWQIQRRITLPLLGPTIRIWAFLSIIGSLQLFDLVYIIWGQYIAATAGTSTMATYMVANGRNAGNYGYGNAVAVVMFLISLVVALVYQRFVLRRDTAGALTEGTDADDRDDRSPSPPSRPTAARQPCRLRLGQSRRLLRRARRRRAHARAGALHHHRRLPHELADHPTRRRCPTPGCCTNYADVLRSARRSGASARTPRSSRVATTVGVVVLGLMASYVLARYSSGAGRAVRAVRRRPDVPDDGGDHAAVHRACANLGLDELLLGGIILPQIAFAPADDDHHPGAVPAAIPDEIEEAAVDRRMQPPRLLLAHGAAAGAARRHHRRHPRVHRQLEQLPPAAVHPQRRGELHAAARRAGLLVAVLRRTPRRCSPSPRCR